MYNIDLNYTIKIIFICLGYEICINNLFHSNQYVKTNDQKFKDNLKNIFLKVGIENRPIVLIIDKVDFIEEGIVQYCNTCYI